MTRMVFITGSASGIEKIEGLSLAAPEPPMAAADLIFDPFSVTPIVEAEPGIWLKRDDLFTANGARGGKARALMEMLKGAKGVVCAGNRYSPMVSRVARVAELAGVPARCHVAQAKEALVQELDAETHGAEMVRHKIGFLTALVSKAKKDAEERGWVFAPLGVEGPEYFKATKDQVREIAPEVKRIVVCVGSGMTAAGLLAGLDAIGRADVRLLGVQVGMDPTRLLDEWAPRNWCERLELAKVESDFREAARLTARWGIEFDPHYEAKCLPYVRGGDLFWVTAIRSTGANEMPPHTPQPPGRLPAEAVKDPSDAPAPAPAWAKGFDLAELKEMAGIFRAFDKPYVQGAFTGIKENAIADAWAAGKLVAWREGKKGQGKPLALAIVAAPNQRRAVADFSERLIGYSQPGDQQIKRIAAVRDELLAPLLTLAGARAAGRSWLEIWQEHGPSRAAAAELGYRWVGSKIMASSEIVGVWAKGIEDVAPPPAEECVGLCRLAHPSIVYMNGFAFAVEAVERVGEFAQHYSSYNKRQSWTALALRGYGGDSAFIIKPAEMSKKWKEENAGKLKWQLSNTPLRLQLAALEPLIAAIPGEKHRIRLMKLAAGDGELTRHADITDPDAGVQPGKLMRIHIPLKTNPDVMFSQWLLSGQRVDMHMPLGQPCYIDTRKPHTAINRGAEDRIHLVLDVESTPALLAMLPPPF